MSDIKPRFKTKKTKTKTKQNKTKIYSTVATAIKVDERPACISNFIKRDPDNKESLKLNSVLGPI